MVTEPARRLFTVDEYYRMASAGIFSEDDRVELIEGEIIAMPPIGGRHASCVNRLNRLFARTLGDEVVLAIQNPLRLGEGSEPVPDVLLLQPRADFYREHPTPADVLLLVEVADTTAKFDRRVKPPLYGRSGITEVWIIDLDRSIIDVQRGPAADGYRLAETKRRGEQLSPAAFPDQWFLVDDILG